MTHQELLQNRESVVELQAALVNKARTENRNMTAEEFSSFEKMEKEIGEIERMAEAITKVESRFVAPVAPIASSKEEFSLGETLCAVAAASSPRGRVDQRILNATGMTSNIPSEGGFLLSPTRSADIMQKLYTGEEVVSRCSVFEIGANSDSFEVPYVEETSRANGSRWGGIRAYREGEIDDATHGEPKIGLWERRLSDIKARVYVTERLLADAVSLESFIMTALPQEFGFKLQDEIINGAGAAACSGVVGNAATVSVAKQSGQVADTVVFENISKAWSRCWGRSRGNAAWFINQDVEQQLFGMSMNVGTGGVPVYMPAGGISGQPYATLFGRPVIAIEQAGTVGDAGDIILADFSEYALIRKGGLNSAASIHYRFVYDEMTFKFSMRVNGAPKWKSVLTPFKGANTLSPFVTIAARA